MIREHTQHIGILSVSLHIPDARSLKEKRMVLKSLKDKVRSRFNVSIAELDGHDKWQVAVCDMAMIGGDRRRIDSCLQNILKLIDSHDGLELTDHQIEFL